MSREEKIIAAYLLIFLVVTIVVIVYMNYTLGNIAMPTVTVKKMNFVRVADVNRTDIFLAMSDIEKYPKVLPMNFVSVSIINQSDNTIYAEEEVTESGFTTKLLVKHTISPYDKHVLEIIEGDAKGTTITESYEDSDSNTKITTDIEMHLHGVLIPFGLLPEDNIEHAVNTVITRFVEYTKNQARE